MPSDFLPSGKLLTSGVLSSVWASAIGPQGYRLATPRVSLLKPSVPALLNYPDNGLSLLQPLVEGPGISFSAQSNSGELSSLFRAPNVTPIVFEVQRPRSAINTLTGLQRSFGPFSTGFIFATIKNLRSTSL